MMVFPVSVLRKTFISESFKMLLSYALLDELLLTQSFLRYRLSLLLLLLLLLFSSWSGQACHGTPRGFDGVPLSGSKSFSF